MTESVTGETTANSSGQAQNEGTSGAIRQELAEGAGGRAANLYDFFLATDGSKSVRQWASSFGGSHMRSFCHVLSTILQIAGYRVEVTTDLFEGDCYQQVMEEFQDEADRSGAEPPYMSMMKEKDGAFQLFWKELTEAMLSCNALFSPMFGSFREWIVQFSQCKARGLRTTASCLLFALMRALVNALAQHKREIERLTGILEKNEAVESQITALEREMRIFVAVGLFIEQNVAVPRARDVDPIIRAMTVSCLTEAAVAFPNVFGDIQKVKYVGMALSDATAKTRRDALRCFERLLREINDKELHVELSDRFAERIVEMTDDRDNAVVSSALDCLLAMSERWVLDDVECSHASDLLNDDSQAIRASAATFVIHHFFKDAEAQSLGGFVKFVQSLREPDEDITGAVVSLYPYIRCLRQWESICDALVDEENDVTVRMLAKILLYSCERTVGKIFNCQREPDKKVRKMTTAVVKNLPKLLKAFQADRETVVPLLEVGGLLNLDAVSDASADHMYQQLLAEIRDLFIRSRDREIFRTAISSLYELSLGHHQLSEMARKELDRLAVECANIEASDDDKLIAKFVAAARLVDVSDGGKNRDRIIDQIYVTTDEVYIADCIECLQYFFKWDISHVRKKPEMKVSYLALFNSYMQIFSEQMASEYQRVKIASFRALSDLMALSVFIKEDEEILLDKLVSDFYCTYHSLPNKLDMFKHAQRPIQTHAVDLAYAPHLLVYYGDEIMQVQVKSLWKEISSYGILPGTQYISAIQRCNVENSARKVASRFLAGKLQSSDVLSAWFDEEKDELLPVILPFFFSVTPEQAASMIAIASDRFEPILKRISDGEKPTQKMFSCLLSVQRSTKKREAPGLRLEADVPRDDTVDGLELEEPGESFVSTRNK